DRQADQMLAAIAPALAAVGRAHHAADFERGIDLVRPARVARETHDPDREWRLAAIRQLWIGLPRPALARVGAAIDRCRRAARPHAPRISGGGGKKTTH